MWDWGREREKESEKKTQNNIRGKKRTGIHSYNNIIKICPYNFEFVCVCMYVCIRKLLFLNVYDECQTIKKNVSY